MTGVEPLQLGIPSFQATFSSLVQRKGRFFSLLRPFTVGPRHCGQFCAEARVSERITTAKTPKTRLRIVSSSFKLLAYGVALPPLCGKAQRVCETVHPTCETLGRLILPAQEGLTWDEKAGS